MRAARTKSSGEEKGEEAARDAKVCKWEVKAELNRKSKEFKARRTQFPAQDDGREQRKAKYQLVCEKVQDGKTMNTRIRFAVTNLLDCQGTMYRKQQSMGDKKGEH